jgi:hypothetical protein
MFPTEPLMTAIHADRLRDLERRSREQRLLHPGPVEWADERAGSPAPLGTTVRPVIQRTSPLTRTGRSAGSACEAV